MAKTPDAILHWVAVYRPDLLPAFQAIIKPEPLSMQLASEHDQFIVMFTSCFEAGRLFQSDQLAPHIYLKDSSR